MKALFLLATAAFFTTLNAQSVAVSSKLEQARRQLATQAAEESDDNAKQAAKPQKRLPKKLTQYIKLAEAQTGRMTLARLKAIRKLANNTGSINEKNIQGFVLSSDITNFSDISPDIAKQITMIKEDMVMLFRLVAVDIEMQRVYGSGALTMDNEANLIYHPNNKLPQQLNDKREKLLTANLSNNVAIRSASLAIKTLIDLNNAMIEEAHLTQDPKEARQIYITQAVYLYEMTEVAMKILAQITFDTKEIATQYQANRTAINARVATIDGQIAKAQALFEAGHLSLEKAKQQTLTAARVKLLNERRLAQWGDVINTLEKQFMLSQNLKSSTDILAYNHEQAKLQLETLRELMQISELKGAFEPLDELVKSAQEIDLVSLDEKTVRSLLGYSENL